MKTEMTMTMTIEQAESQSGKLYTGPAYNGSRRVHVGAGRKDIGRREYAATSAGWVAVEMLRAIARAEGRA